MNIGILSNYHEPLLIHFLSELKNVKKINFILILANISEKKNLREKRIFQDRTRNFFLTKKNFYNVKHLMDTYFVNNHNDKKTLQIIAKHKIDYLFNCGTPNKIKKKTLLATKGVINIHPGILPYYKGCTCVEWSLYNKDPVGITAHFMNENYDSGPIIKKKYVFLKNCKLYHEIRIKVYLSIIKLFKSIIINLGKKEIKKNNQDKIKGTFYKIISTNKLSYIKKKLSQGKYSFNEKNL